MKNSIKKRILVLSTFLVLILATVAAADAFGPFFGMGGSGPRMLTKDDFTRPIEQLGLTDEQRAQLKKMQEENYRKNEALWEEMRKLNFELRQLMLEKNPDEALVQKKIDRLNEIRKDLHEARIKNRDECWNILTDEQKEKIKSSWNNRRGGRMGRGRGPGAW